MERRSFRAMGTTIELFVDASSEADSALQTAEAVGTNGHTTFAGGLG